jgi:hypothetical protein
LVGSVQALLPFSYTPIACLCWHVFHVSCSKLLTEQVVDDPTTLPGVAKVIVRPSLISSIANQPYPG